MFICAEMVMVESLDSEQNSFSINFDCKMLYSLIKPESVDVELYPRYFKMIIPIEDSVNIPIVLKLLPLKTSAKHISIWAEITAPIPQSSTLGQITIEATAFNPSKGRDCGQLGDPVRRTEQVKRFDTAACDEAYWRLVLEEVVLEMFAFYCKQVQIDIKIMYRGQQ